MNAASGGGDLKSLVCDRCGASIQLTNELFLTCPYCGQIYNLSARRGPGRGELLLSADLRDPNVPGWHVYHKENLLFGYGGYPQLIGNFRRRDTTAWILESS